MKIDVFGKKHTTEDGKKFYTYLSKLKKKDGTEVTAQVKFREECGNPKKLPCTIEFDKKDANYNEIEDSYVAEDGTEVPILRRVLWVSNYIENEYVDISMDDFD